jgi:hypothetical protein
MPDVPQAVLDYLQGTLIEERSPAWLQVRHDGCLLSASGHLERYGLSAAAPGQAAAAQISLLEGMLPLDGEEVLLPHVQTPSGRYADIFLLGRELEDWVVFLDAEIQHGPATPRPADGK